MPRNIYLRLRGLPQTVALTEGHAIAPGVWAVPLSVLPALATMVPIGAGYLRDRCSSRQPRRKRIGRGENDVGDRRQPAVVTASRGRPGACTAPHASANTREREQALHLYSKGLQWIELGAAEAGDRLRRLGARYWRLALGAVAGLGRWPHICASVGWRHGVAPTAQLNPLVQVCRIPPRRACVLWPRPARAWQRSFEPSLAGILLCPPIPPGQDCACYSAGFTSSPVSAAAAALPARCVRRATSSPTMPRRNSRTATTKMVP